MGRRVTISELKVKGMYRCRVLAESIHSTTALGVWDKPENIEYGFEDFPREGNLGSIKINDVFMVIEEARSYVAEFAGSTTYAKIFGASIVGYIAALQLDTIFEEITKEEINVEETKQKEV